MTTPRKKIFIVMLKSPISSLKNHNWLIKKRCKFDPGITKDKSIQ